MPGQPQSPFSQNSLWQLVALLGPKDVESRRLVLLHSRLPPQSPLKEATGQQFREVKNKTLRPDHRQSPPCSPSPGRYPATLRHGMKQNGKYWTQVLGSTFNVCLDYPAAGEATLKGPPPGQEIEGLHPGLPGRFCQADQELPELLRW